ncbi:MAG TPA: DUF4926 domain-containing protein [Balneolaceae bacterium]|nr:DUF4926 domain-containing protein [Balneolaceae bacterium]
MEKFKKLDTVALLTELPSKSLYKGQVGTIVEKLDEKTFEVEFCNKKGETITIAPLKKEELMLLHFDSVTA